MLLALLTVLLALVLALLWWRRPVRPADAPPGPPTRWLLGNLIELVGMNCSRLSVAEALQQLGNDFGPVFSLVHPGGRLIVVVRDVELVKTAAAQTELSGRPANFCLRFRNFNCNLGLLFSEGDVSNYNRRFVLRALKDMGSTKHTMETHIVREYQELAAELLKDDGGTFPMNDMFLVPAFNVIWQLIAARRYALHDERMQRVFGLVRDFVRRCGPLCLANLAPPLRYVFPEWSGFTAVRNHRDALMTLFAELAKEHRADRHQDDLIARYLRQHEHAGQPAERNLAFIVMDLFIAGSETVATSLGWAVLYMVLHPAVQAAVHRELDAVVGPDRLPSLHDRTRLPYTEATLNEVARMASVVPIALAHNASFCETRIAGYRIPVGSMVLFDLHSVHHDPHFWGDPAAFRPERFLTDQGQLRKDIDHLLPFGTGKRQCIGEPLARMEMFLFFSCLLHQFRLSAADGQPPPVRPASSAGMLMPQPFSVQVSRRSGHCYTGGGVHRESLGLEPTVTY